MLLWDTPNPFAASRVHRFMLAFAAVAVTLSWAADARAHACPQGKECTYFPALMPPPTSQMVVDPNTCHGALLFASPDIDSFVDFSYKNHEISQHGINEGQVAFTYTPNGSNIASAFNVAENSGAVMTAGRGYIFSLQLEACATATYGARIRNHTSALGTRFRVAGFSLDASNGDDAGFDYLGIYAPEATTVTATLPTAAYARLQTQSPGRRFWQRNAGPTVQVSLAEGESILLRTQGADMVPGARGFPIDGTLVTSDKPISITVGGRGWAFDSQNNAVNADDGGDGVVPFKYLGTQYVVRAYKAPHAQQLRIVADHDNTSVRVNGAYVATLHEGETYTTPTPPGVSFIETSEKTAVFQSAGLYGAHNDLGLVPPVVFAPITHLNIPLVIFTGDLGTIFFVVPTASAQNLMIDGAPLINFPDATWSSVPQHPEWMTASLDNVPAGRYLITATSNVVAAVAAGNDNPGHGTFVYISRMRRPGCGDGVIAVDEECDDGNIASFDGCSSMCNIEKGYTCAGSPSVCALPSTGPQTANDTRAQAPNSVMSCALVGCPILQWCSDSGCLPQRNNAVSCSADQQCLAKFCANDGYCGRTAGDLCAEDYSCRSNACADGHCLSLTAQAQGDGLMACSTTGYRGPPRSVEYAGLVACAAWMFWRTRRKRSRTTKRMPNSTTLGLLLVMGLLKPTPVYAAADDVQTIRVTGFDPSPLAVQQSSGPFFSQDTFAPPLQFHGAQHLLELRLSAMFVHRPLVVRETDTQEVLAAIVHGQTALRLSAAYWWRDRLRASLNVPLQLHATGERAWASPVPYPAPSQSPALGDLNLSLLWVYWQPASRAWRLSLGASGTLSTGSTAAYAGNGASNAAAQLGLAGQRGAYDYTVAVLRRLRSAGRKDNLARRPLALTYRFAGGRYFAQDVWHLGLELTVSTVAVHNLPTFAKHAFWLEPIVSARYQISRRWSLTAGAGTSLTQAPGAASYRVFIATNFVPFAYTPKPTAKRTSMPSPVTSEPKVVTVAPIIPPVAPVKPDSAAQVADVALPEIIHFALQSDALSPEAHPALVAVAQTLSQASGEARLHILGYTDDRGPKPYNMVLAKNRANAVRRALIALGVAEERLQAEGRGPQDFIASNATRPGRERNRRVVFVVRQHPVQ